MNLTGYIAMDYRKESLKKHQEWQGKIEIKPRVEVDSKDALSLAYTPGVAEPCLAIRDNPELSFELTRRWNTVAVITDGTAILGLGNIGPEAGMPVMEGKAALFKAYGDVDAVPLCLHTQDSEEIIKTIKIIAGSFGGINLEDIAAPRCFEIEKRLIDELDIPLFHDDQHGTAIVVGAALLNALKLVEKDIEKIKVVINGPGAAGTAIAKFLLSLGVKHMKVCGINGLLSPDDESLNPAQHELAVLTNPEKQHGLLADALVGADVFIGVSVGNIVTPSMIASMSVKPIVFALANPIPEITPEKAKEGGAYIVGTGSSEYPNQINNVLVFPGLFRGALDARSKITEVMMIAACKAIAEATGDISIDRILPLAYEKATHQRVAKAVYEAASRPR